MKYVYSGILLSHETEGDAAICSNMDGPSKHYAKWDKSEKDILYDLIGEILKNLNL